MLASSGDLRQIVYGDIGDDLYKDPVSNRVGWCLTLLPGSFSMTTIVRFIYVSCALVGKSFNELDSYLT